MGSVPSWLEAEAVADAATLGVSLAVGVVDGMGFGSAEQPTSRQTAPIVMAEANE